MKDIKDMRTLKEGDNILFQNKHRGEIRWVGKVDKVNNKENYVEIIYFSLWEVRKQIGSFPLDWNKEGSWILYKITKKEAYKCNKELILLNLE